MANPFHTQFDSRCHGCDDEVEEGELMYANEGSFLCSECALGEDIVCQCGKYKKTSYTTCYECRFGKTYSFKYSQDPITKNAPSEQEWKDNIKKLVFLCHPDKHGNSDMSNKITAWLLNWYKKIK